MEDESKELWILLPNREELAHVSSELDKLLNDYPGGTKVFIQLKEEKRGLVTRNTVHVDEGLLSQLKLEYGANSVLVRDVKKSE